MSSNELISIRRYRDNVDKILTQIQFYKKEDNKPLGVINWFAIHPTSMNNTNHLVSSDNIGYASILFERIMNNDSLIGKVRSDVINLFSINLFYNYYVIRNVIRYLTYFKSASIISR